MSGKDIEWHNIIRLINNYKVINARFLEIKFRFQVISLATF